MVQKTVRFDEDSIEDLPNNMPAVYEVLDDNIGSAKRARVRQRLNEHLDEGMPGTKVKILQADSIDRAQQKESRLIEKLQPRFNKKGK